MDPTTEVEIIKTVGVIEERSKAAHQRIDKMEILLREDLGEIIDEVKSISKWMNTSKGWAAAALFTASILGGLIAAFVKVLFK